ncbi:F0F1 ATP synthase subunit A [Secundilactobacillus collinoides]|uniref:ATP synthase subunit a n=1 Tax=Secundilactobacillus collinoides TaxID=33960 RepID=A0A166GUV4_SECCO|nr:F0F1 ATP synthase subunit A [Secundilactobacillus collinoides]KZL40208.1 ATP synthase subunit A [Secundilactobacillus collinoides]
MGDPSSVPTFQLGGLTFNVTNMISGLIAFVFVFLFVFALSRHITMKPGRGQNILEWLVDFTNNILKGSIPGNETSAFGLYGFTLFLFLFVSNELGLFIQISLGGKDWVRSPTSDPIVTMTFSLATLMIAQYAGVMKFGWKKHFSGYLKPFVFWLPISIFEEFTNFLTLGLRIFGVIYSGEMLLKIIGEMAFSGGIASFGVAVVLALVWQGFSAFLGAIQAFVFVTLSSVYIADKIEID